MKAMEKRAEKENRKREKRSVMSYAVWVDILINTAIIVSLTVVMRQALAGEIDGAIAKTMLAAGSETFQIMAFFTMLALGVCAVMGFILNAVYIIIEARKKEPYLTEKYMQVFGIGKILAVVFLVLSWVIF